MPEAIPWRIYAGHEVEEHEILYEVVDAESGEPVEGMTYKLISNGKTLLDSQPLRNGKSESRSFNEHPNLNFVAWIEGAKK